MVWLWHDIIVMHDITFTTTITIVCYIAAFSLAHTIPCDVAFYAIRKIFITLGGRQSSTIGSSLS
jgi:hypothetical protein